jgi:hypothetical protein
MYRFIAAASLIGSFIVPTLRGSNLADRRIPAEPDRSIKLPVSPEKAIAVIQDTLLAAGVASGVEQAAPGSDSSLVGVPPTDGKLTLSGRRVRDAFDDFVSFDPRYRWFEANGRVFLTPRIANNPDQLLQKRLSLEARGSPIREVLSRLCELVLTPKHSVMTVHLRSGETASEPSVSVHLRDATLFDSLNAVATATRGMSWRVRYRTPTPTADGATIEFVTRDVIYSAFPQSP